MRVFLDDRMWFEIDDRDHHAVSGPSFDVDAGKDGVPAALLGGGEVEAHCFSPAVNAKRQRGSRKPHWRSYYSGGTRFQSRRLANAPAEHVVDLGILLDDERQRAHVEADRAGTAVSLPAL